MKLLRLKITDPDGFRSLQSGFEYHFRTEWILQEELSQSHGFSPFVCAGPNGSGKSNLLEVLAAIFFQLEIMRVRRQFLPEVFQSEEFDYPPFAFELDYHIRLPLAYQQTGQPDWAKVQIQKYSGAPLRLLWENQSDFAIEGSDLLNSDYFDMLLPQYVLGYSSGENEILSLPFFKMRFVQYDEYWNALTTQLAYPGHPETRLAYLDNEFSQAILICNLLFQDETTLQPFREDVGIETLKEFRIVLKRNISLPAAQLEAFDQTSIDEKTERRNRLLAEAKKSGLSDSEFKKNIEDLIRREIVARNPALKHASDEEDGLYNLNLLHLLEGDEKSSLMINALKRCATLWYFDEALDSLILDYWVNDATKQAFKENFENSPLSLFQAFQVLLTLNLYSTSEQLKKDLYQSNSHYVSETVPTLASDQRIMRFKYVRFTKQGVTEPIMLKELSDGEHQLIHSLGLCLLFRDTNSLFLLDEPETHFNPHWRANFITRLRECFAQSKEKENKHSEKKAIYDREMLITTHTPFLISDSRKEKVLEFSKQQGLVSVKNPEYATLGASINKITMRTFDKRETIGAHAQSLLDAFRIEFEQGHTENEALVTRIDNQLGDSVEKILLINAILNSDQKNTDKGEN